MILFREIVSKVIIQGYDVLSEFGYKFEMVLVPFSDIFMNEKNEKINYQEENCFSKQILALYSEDIWNDI